MIAKYVFEFAAIAIILGILFLVLGVLIVLFFRALVDAFIAGVRLKFTARNNA